MKRYVPIVIGVAALCAVLYVGNGEMKKHRALEADEQKSSLSSKNYRGEVMRNFEGENVLAYGFDIPETATTTTSKEGALVNVTDGGAPLLAMYLSYEGGRGYSPEEYVSNVIVPRVKVLNEVGTTTIGSHDWFVVESQWSVWHIAKSEDSQWLLVVENTKANAEKANAIIESIATK